MSTHAKISLKTETGYKTIYNYFDGYLDGLGKTLLFSYNTQEKVEQLISMGGASAVEETLDKSIFYHRDRGEDIEIEMSSFELESDMVDYIYMFEDGNWYVKTRRRQKTLLTEEMVRTGSF